MSSSKKLTIYTFISGFPNPARLKLFLHEKGIADLFNEQIVDVIGGDHRSWRFGKKNPSGEVPCLELADGRCLSEVAAIVPYLDAIHAGTRKVTGTDPLQTAFDSQWEARVRTNILTPLLTFLHVGKTALGEWETTHNEPWAEHCRKTALAGGAQINDLLSDGRSWLLAGDEPTFADITLCTAISLSNGGAQTSLTHRYEHIDQYYQRWSKRDSFKRAYGDGKSGIKELDQASGAK